MGAVLKAAKVNWREQRLRDIDVEAELCAMAIKDAHKAKRDAEKELTRSHNESLKLKRERLDVVAAIEKDRAAALERAQSAQKVG